MNFLAHLYLADHTAEAHLGAMLGDFVKGAAKNAYAPVIRENIELHRRIDSYTDSHPLITSSKSFFVPERRRVSGILLDVIFDHFLAKNWSRYSTQSLPNFVQPVYRVLENHRPLLPEKLQKILPYLIAEDWLTSYREMAWIEITIRRMSRRLTHGAPLVAGLIDLKQNYAALERVFDDFFPELISQVERLKQEKESRLDSPETAL